MARSFYIHNLELLLLMNTILISDAAKPLNGFVNNYGAETTSSEDGFSNSSEDMIPDEIVQLKRRVGLFSGVALIVGTMIGISMSLLITRLFP